MITEKDLREAITECLNATNPNANTCIKLAAFYTILNQMPKQDYSYSSESDFAKAIKGKDINKVIKIIDGLMDRLLVVNPNLYDDVMQKINRE